MGGIIMNENINLTKILKGCPNGTIFYSSIFGEVSFVEIPNCYDKYPIRLQAYNKSTQSILDIYYTEDGSSVYKSSGSVHLRNVAHYFFPMISLVMIRSFSTEISPSRVLHLL